MREILNITAVSNPEAIPTKDGKTFDKYTVQSGDKTFSTYSKRLVALLRPGQAADVEWENTPYGTKITDVYVEGKSAPRGGYQKQDKDYKADPAKILSMNQESAFRGTVELLVAKVIDPIHPLGIAAINWALRMLQGETVETKIETKPAPSSKIPPGAPEAQKTGIPKGTKAIPRKDLEETLFHQSSDLVKMKIWTEEKRQKVLTGLGAKGQTIKQALASLSEVDLLAFQMHVIEGLKEIKP